MKRLVMIDRDGTLTVERNYLASPEQLELIERSASALRLLRAAGLPAVVVTNQSGLARGYFDQPTLERIHARLSDMLAAEGAVIDAFYVCPHHPDDRCQCRKPAAALAHRAAADFSADLRASFVIGDKPCDLGLGKAVGATTILVRTGYGADVAQSADAAEADYIVGDLYDAASLIRQIVEEQA